MLIFLAALNLVHHRERSIFTRKSAPVLVQLISGIILCLLGLLAIGANQLVISDDFNVTTDSPLYDLIDSNWALGTVTIVYAATWVISVVSVIAACCLIAQLTRSRRASYQPLIASNAGDIEE